MEVGMSSIQYVSGLPWAGVSYFTTQRHGGVSTGDWASLNVGGNTADDPEVVRENRARLATLLPTQPYWLQQVHGADVVDADSDAPLLPQADAAVTTQKERVLAVLTADCLPVVISDEAATVLGVAHAGWRGLAAGVLEQTLAAMRRKQPQHTRLRAWVGPAISQAHFEVGGEVLQAMMVRDTQARQFFVYDQERQKYYADLPALARYFLMQACDGEIDVMLSGECTVERSDRYFSYRRSGQTGRIATVAWLLDQT